MGIALDGASIFTSGWAAALIHREKIGCRRCVSIRRRRVAHGDGSRRRRREPPPRLCRGRYRPLAAAAAVVRCCSPRSQRGAIDRDQPGFDGADRRWLRAGAGAVQAFIEAAAAAEATVIGKPQAGIFQQALSSMGLEAHETIMVGDTIDTDIRGARAAKLRSVLVESGNANVSSISADIQSKILASCTGPFRHSTARKGDAA